MNGATNDSLTIQVYGKCIYIHTSKAISINIYGIDGKIAKSVNAVEGMNIIDSLEPGIYIINRKKVLIR